MSRQFAGLNVNLTPDLQTGHNLRSDSRPNTHIHSQNNSEDLRGLANQGVLRGGVTYDTPANLLDSPGGIDSSSPDPSSSVGSFARDDSPPVKDVIDNVIAKFRESGYLSPAEEKTIANFIRLFYTLYFYPFGHRTEERNVNGFLEKLTTQFGPGNPLASPFSDHDIDELKTAFTRLEKGGKLSWDLRASFILKLSPHQLGLLHLLIWKLTRLDPCNRNFVLVQSGKSWMRRLVSLVFIEKYWIANGVFPLSAINNVQSDRVNAKPDGVICHKCHNSQDPAVRNKSTFDTRQRAAAHVNSLHVRERFRCGRCSRSFSRMDDRTRHWTKKGHHPN
ncbi:hypothetical protein PIIN_05574 [Serendipita indica DSM 11827]|uniref:C2H2-type domain-containing protein n=1 Tax=Serendipita indica (strain DSM 11827) TaxID=1109443 RepID=G4TJZ1_SERID|nr:hypothetical protein PIIN_05574 [Serendipita indica DSM 11827]